MRRSNIFRPCPPPRTSALLAALTLSTGLLSACGGGSSDSPAAPPFRPTLVRVATEAAGTHCGVGGVRIESGMDADLNGALSDAEVNATQYVCNGANGSDGHAGAPGSSGSNGSNGLTTLVRVRVEPSGGHCAQGGSAVLAGVDANADGALEDAEVSSTGYICNGATGATGPAGSNGAAGPAGTPGATGPEGSAGYDSLLLLSAEPAGSHCTYGGQQVRSGLDTNRNGVLEAGEVNATAYVCSAAPADTQWVNVTGTSAQAAPNTGYLANSSSPVTITLPTAPAIGDWIKITGVGSGGWTVAQNPGQRITTRALPGGMPLNWTATPLSGDWSGVAMSADGVRQVAVSTSGGLFVSTDGGNTWLQRLAGQPWSGVTASADGMKMVATTNGGALFISNDGGSTWNSDGSARAWAGVASSANGNILAAVAYLDGIYTSSDGGLSWTLHESGRAFRAVAASADGRVMVAATNGAQLYVSTDYGATWSARAGADYWWSVAASSDGQWLYATADTGRVWVSYDYGNNWIARDTARSWRGIATSADGRFTVATTAGDRIYQSSDYGATWTPTADAGPWGPVASSSDGLILAAGKVSANLYGGARQTSTTPGATGSLSGGRDDALQLQYVGGGVFMPIAFVAANLSFTVH